MAEETEAPASTESTTPSAGGNQQETQAPSASAAANPSEGNQSQTTDGTSLFDLASDTDATITKDVNGKGTKPDWIPDQFWDAEKGEPLLRELVKSQQDLRAKVSRGEGKVPEKAEAYALPKIEGLPDNAVPADDPLWSKVRQAAHASGVTQKQLDAVLAPYLEYARDQMFNKDPTADREGMRRAAEEELGKLGPNGRMLIKDIGGWLAGMESRGSLTKDEVQALRGVGSAAGIRALAKLRELSGERPMPLDHLVADTMSEQDARRLLVESKGKRDQAGVDRALSALRRLEQAGVLGA